VTSDRKFPRAGGETIKPLTDADRIALASAALAILPLPYMLQQYSNASDMLDILAGEPCDRAGEIIHQAHEILNGYSAMQPNRHKDVRWSNSKNGRAEVEKLVADALAKRWALIVDEENGLALLER
jgi:hypothetical protein